MTQAIWPVHRKGAMWSFALVRVTKGFAFIPLEVTASRLVGGGLGLTVAIGLALAANALGLLDDVGPQARLVAALVSLFVGDQLGKREATRRLRRMLDDPERHLGKRGAFVIPAGARILDSRKGWKGGRATVEWWDPSRGTRQAVLTMPSASVDEFLQIWASVLRGGP